MATATAGASGSHNASREQPKRSTNSQARRRPARHTKQAVHDAPARRRERATAAPRRTARPVGHEPDEPALQLSSPGRGGSAQPLDRTRQRELGAAQALDGVRRGRRVRSAPGADSSQYRAPKPAAHRLAPPPPSASPAHAARAEPQHAPIPSRPRSAWLEDSTAPEPATVDQRRGHRSPAGAGAGRSRHGATGGRTCAARAAPRTSASASVVASPAETQSAERSQATSADRRAGHWG